VPARVSPTERIRAEIDQLFSADQDLGETLEEVARLGARLLLHAALEAEVCAAPYDSCSIYGTVASHRGGMAQAPGVHRLPGACRWLATPASRR
jgi:hypothetical protein